MLDSLKTGEFIREARKKKGLSQNELADRLNITRVAVSKWENGHNLPDIVIMKELAEILDVDINEIMEGETIEKQTPVPFEEKKKNRWLRPVTLALLAVIMIFGEMTYTIPWDREAMAFRMERVLKYDDQSVTGILYYLEYNYETVRFMRVSTREYELTDQNGNTVKALVVSLSRSGFEILLGNQKKNNQEILSILRGIKEPAEGYGVLCYYTGSLNDLDNITDLNAFLTQIRAKAGWYYAFTE